MFKKHPRVVVAGFSLRMDLGVYACPKTQPEGFGYQERLPREA
jgi:hypothetical protein